MDGPVRPDIWRIDASLSRVEREIRNWRSRLPHDQHLWGTRSNPPMALAGWLAGWPARLINIGLSVGCLEQQLDDKRSSKH